jgi:hypothetical protein
MRPRPGLAVLALTAALAASGLVRAQQPTPVVAPAAEPVPAPPAAPIPYTQIVKQRQAAAARAEASAEPVEPPKPTGPLPRVRATSAILQALDKVTTETMRFEAPIGKSIRYKDLIFTVRACETAAPDELAPEAVAYVVINSAPKAQPGRDPVRARQVFRGWMFASTPSVDPVEHPVYDAWLIACKTAAPSPENR